MRPWRHGRPVPAQPARAASDDRIVAGVCAGIARRVGVDPPIVRIAAIVLAVTGVGIPLYLLAWVVLPDDNGAGTAEATAAARHHQARRASVWP
ncbi:MAG: PspC domain-containing protein [Acidimicrobiales bacterium]